MKQKIISGFPILCSTLTVLALLRIVELIILGQSQFLANPLNLLFAGLFNDLVFTLILWPFLFLVILTGKRGIITAFTILIGILLIFDLASAFYFNISLYPIDRTVYQFSAKEIINIVRTFGEFKWYYILLIAPLPLLFFFEILYRKKKIAGYFCLTAAILITGIHVFSTSEKTSDFDRLLSKNGVTYFVSDSYNYFKNKQRANESPVLTTKAKKYGLIHPVDKSDPLSSYFRLNPEPPNIVFIIVESLSSSFSGPRADEVSLTPFLDSLSRHALYFRNFISTAERTFGVLPSSLASLPHGKKGFLKMELNMPEHQSIISLLVQNGYNATFFYGGDADYDHMRDFMENNGVKTIVDNHEEYSAAEAKWNEDGGVYGKSDQILFKEAADSWQHQLTSPFIHCYLTLSTHQPFKIENQEHYKKLTLDIINRAAKEKGINPKKYTSNLQVFSTFVYSDEAIKKLFQRYEKEDSFKNTIFFIYGDHMMGPFPKKNSLENYEVPLYIYSPLLKKAKSIGAVNSHLDIPPSIFSLLKHRYIFDLPHEVHWLGKPFDMDSKVIRGRQVVLMLNSRETPDFLADELYLSKGELYHLDTNLTPHHVSNQSLLDSIEQLQDSLIYVQTNAIEENELVRKEKTLIYLEEQTNNNVTFSQNTEYVSLFDYTFKKDEASILTQIQLDFEQIMNKSDTVKSDSILKPPKIVLTLKGSENQNIIWTTIPYNFPNDSNKYSLNLTRYFKNNSSLPLNAGSRLKMYFWNSKRSNAKFYLIKSDILLNSIQE